MNEQTSSRVSSIASSVLAKPPLPEGATADHGAYNSLLESAKTLAGSCMTQDETPGNDDRPAFLVRLERERAELHERTTKLAEFLGKGCPGVASDDEKTLLLRQHSYMANYLALLNQRGTMHGLDPLTIPELTLGEDDGA